MIKKIAYLFGTLVVFSSVVMGNSYGKNVALAPIPIVEEEVDESRFYWGAELSYQRVYGTDSGWFSETKTQDELFGVGLILGYDFNEYISVEGRAATSIEKQDYADVTTYSIFLKPQYPVTKYFKLYGLLGFGSVQIDGAENDESEEPGHPDMRGKEILNDTMFQWGFGASYEVIVDILVFIDYTSLANDADISSTFYGYDPKIYDKINNDALTVGFTYKF